MYVFAKKLYNVSSCVSFRNMIMKVKQYAFSALKYCGILTMAVVLSACDVVGDDEYQQTLTFSQSDIAKAESLDKECMVHAKRFDNEVIPFLKSSLPTQEVGLFLFFNGENVTGHLQDKQPDLLNVQNTIADLQKQHAQVHSALSYIVRPNFDPTYLYAEVPVDTHQTLWQHKIRLAHPHTLLQVPLEVNTKLHETAFVIPSQLPNKWMYRILNVETQTGASNLPHVFTDIPNYCVEQVQKSLWNVKYDSVITRALGGDGQLFVFNKDDVLKGLNLKSDEVNNEDE